MCGYSMPEIIFKEQTKKMVEELFEVLRDDKLPFALFKVMLNVVESRISKMDTYDRIKKLIEVEEKFPAIELTEEMENYLSTLNPSDLGIEKQYFEALLMICERFEGGLEGHMKIVITELLESFLETERYFQDVSYDNGVSAIKSDIGDITRVVRMVYSHTRVKAKNILLKELLSRVSDNHSLMASLQPVLKQLANLFSPDIEPLALYVREVLNKMHQTSYGQVCSNMTRKTSERSLGDLVALCSNDGGESILKKFVSSNGEDDLVLHEFFLRKMPRPTMLPTGNNKALIFKFEIGKSTPMYGHKSGNSSPIIMNYTPQLNGAAKPSDSVVYFLSVLSELDLLRHRKVVDVLKHTPSTGKTLREEIGTTLTKSGVTVQGVDLMLSRPSHPPLYTQYDFSAKEKLELYRLPAEVEDVSVSTSSPYMLFKHNDHGVLRIFVRCLLRDVASALIVDKYSRTSSLELLKNKIIDVLDGACGEIRVCSAADKVSKAPYDCNHILLRLGYDPQLSTQAGGTLLKRLSRAARNCWSNTESYSRVLCLQSCGRQVDAHHQGYARLAGETIYAPHHSIHQVQVQKKRFQANKIGTTYVYDYPLIFGQAVLNLWLRFKETDPESYQQLFESLPKQLKAGLEELDASTFVQSCEMILQDDEGEIEVCRDQTELNKIRRSKTGENDRGMIAWEMCIYTPDVPSGRKIVVISNDITYQMGSFQ
uniref:CoA carboxyltransferase N-terminal domain-containing protein n=1 Tax=Ditylenchus dipsaci TaxID=166011 RepID=A0A915CYB2_9BILA